jgi:hypothetical protein
MFQVDLSDTGPYEERYDEIDRQNSYESLLPGEAQPDNREVEPPPLPAGDMDRSDSAGSSAMVTEPAEAVSAPPPLPARNIDQSNSAGSSAAVTEPAEAVSIPPPLPARNIDQSNSADSSAAVTEPSAEWTDYDDSGGSSALSTGCGNEYQQGVVPIHKSKLLSTIKTVLFEEAFM